MPSIRHSWTSAQDRQLLSLVQQLGPKWTQISQRMRLGINYMSYRRRWETLHHPHSGAWTLHEDRLLHKLVRQQPHLCWPLIASQLPGSRSPRDCYWRWTQTLTMRRGVRDSPARLWGVRMEKWADIEIRRMTRAIAAVDEVEGESEGNGEPWLTFDERPRGYWQWVAEVVGTRTSQQCLMEWNKRQKLPDAVLSVEEVKALIKLVAQVGRKWEHLSATYFPRMSAHGLSRIYHRWSTLSSQYKVNLHALDPLQVLVNYRENQPWALRPTGADGMYSSNGELKLVRCYKHTEAPSMIPFWLMLKLADQHVPKRRRPKRSKGERRLGDDVDRLIALVRELGEDWTAISKRTGWSATRCCQKYQELAKILPSVHSAPA